MHLARREGFDSLTTNELLLADCHSYMDNRSATKAAHLEQLPLWKTSNMEMRLWINPPPRAMMADNDTYPRNHLLPMRCYTRSVRFNPF